MWYILSFFIGFLVAAGIYNKTVVELRVGDIVLWKRNNIKCIIIDEWCNKFYISDMDGNALNGGHLVHKGVLTKVKERCDGR